MPETKVVGGLKWVKGELVDSLHRVRRQLEAFVAEGGASSGAEAIAALHEVRGVLLALQMTAPARLTEEIKRLLERLIAGSVKQPEEAAEALMLALVQLPHYLEEVDAGRGEFPVILLPSINDLRISRGARPLSAAELVVPSSVLAELESPTPDAVHAFASVAAKVRPHFHRHLLLAFQGDGEHGLTGLIQLFRQLHSFFKEGLFCDAFQAAEAMSSGILDGGIQVTPASKAALGHVDSVFKPLLQREPVWPEMQARHLIGELLPHLVAWAPESALVRELDAKYRSEGPGEEARLLEASHRGLGADAMESLLTEVLRELAAVKDRFDLFVRGGGVAPEQLAPMVSSLQQLANTMAIGEDPSLVSRFQYLADVLDRLVNGGLAGNDAFYLEFAQEILFLEDALHQTVSGDDGRSGANQAMQFALREARADLEKARQAIADYALNPGNLRRLRDALDSLPGVAAALHVVGEGVAADITDGVVALLRERFTDGGRGPKASELDLLAEAVAGVEMHLEGLAQGMSLGVDILSQARSAMERLASGAEPGDASVEGRPGPDTRHPVAPLIEPKFTPVLEGLPDTVADARALATPGEPLGAPADAESLAIFLEEAREEQGRIATALSLWLTDRNDWDALATLRRSYHTLGGSGRLVDATRLAEVAAATEAILDGVLGRKLAAATAVRDYLIEVAALVPALIEAEASGASIEIASLLTAAQGLLEEAPAETQVAPVAGEVCPADSELLEIFVTEAREHLATLSDFLALADREENLVPTTDLVRALHTLCGSARMTEIQSIAAAGGALERLCAAFRERDRVVDAPLRDLLGRVATGIAERLDRLPEAGSEVAALAQAASEATAWTESLIATVPAPLRSPEEGLATLPESEFAVLESEPVAEVRSEVAPEGAPWSEEVSILVSVPEAAPDEIAPDEAELAGTEPVETEVGAEGLALPESDRFLPPSLELEPAPLPALASEPEFEFEPGMEVAVATPVATEAQVVGVGVEPMPASAVSSASAGPAEEAVSVAQGPVEPVLAVEAPADLPADLVEERHAPAQAAPTQTEEPPADAALTALFLEDARDLLDRIDERLRDWQLAPEQRQPLDSIQRLLHTLKGSARLSGLPAIGDLSHALESTLSAVVRGEMAVSDDTLELTQRSLDALSGQVDALERGGVVPVAGALLAALSQTQQGKGAVEGVAVGPVPPVPSVTEGATGAAATAAPPGAAAPQIRVRASLLNRLVNNSGEISIYRARLAQQNGTLGFSLGELDQTVGRLREQLRQMDIETEAQILYRYDREASDSDPTRRDFDPLELDRFSTLQQLSRSISESLNDLVSVKTLIGDIQRELADLLIQQARIADDLQDGLLRTRMVPFMQVVPRLQRLVRQTAQTLGKRATLAVLGSEVELDRSILDRLGGPLEHLLRNALAHGIETPERRQALGKPVEGVIELVLSREGNDVILALADDGGGMDMAAIRRRAAERGLLKGAETGDEELLQLVMEPGFSTVEKVTQIAGRGVGLDVVATEIKRLSGTLTLASEQGKGAAFTMRLPLTLAIIDALLVTLGDATYAIPHVSIEAVARIPRAELDRCYSGLAQEFSYLGEDYRIMHLAGLLNPGTMPDLGERRWLPLLLVRTADQRLALQIDSLIGTQRIVVKPLGTQLSGVRWLNGGTILPDGRVAMILDLLALARSPAIHAYRLLPTSVVEEEPQRACVMVVDDSLTVRRVTSRLLRRQGMDVITASDGVEALALLEERIPDLILLDIEMPRMDGYELSRHIRRSSRFAAIPIIMITSRTGEKHRRMAMDLGVDRYLGKPYQEAELLDEISAVLMDAPA